ncbi:unnamed protein product, partial [Symbiodinium natans]
AKEAHETALAQFGRLVGGASGPKVPLAYLLHQDLVEDLHQLQESVEVRFDQLLRMTGRDWSSTQPVSNSPTSLDALEDEFGLAMDALRLSY